MSLAITTPETHSPAAMRAQMRQSAFQAARRHSVLVRLLRRLIPVGAIAAVVGLIIVPFLNPLRHAGNFSLGGISLSGGKVVMETPKLAGYRKDNSPYEVTAESALQDVRNPTQIELLQMVARVLMKSEGWININARSGLFDQQKEKLKLVDDVKIRTDSGYDVRMRTADVDFKAGTVNSREPVKVNLGTTTVDADTLDVKDNGALITFEGRVHVLIENAPARSLAGPEREGSTPNLEALRPAGKP
ncbi:lipopolysaccharide-assembly, LptC-related protein [Bosea sp. (in: a-proteobacteria)]|uniref:lipopolysaccharide-assembly, LptC-related protein n=1 Tax=Bosea sp. (in: a-proteobacteria) TaxID=1871050 RepID=UPI002DDD6519|nr:lipopolysaccharide-assembly, LptC-related protein [Bosea sp. (in: a-proteobacteria)]HEV2508921.1 lipopolysaccharide-assembly, LptC-related protein [Bosea sp. (in: a-proteobacteria)]